MDTALSRGLYAAGADVQYDDNAKHILGHKTVIAHILARTASEFQGIDPKEIVPLIEAEPQIDEIHVLPGETNKHLPFVSGQNAEITIPGEGRNTFDVRFYVWTPDRRGRIKLLVDLEAQKSATAYSLPTRGIFYGSRMISAQLGTEFVNSDYNHIKKVYSIWLCMNPPKSQENSTIEYRMEPRILSGHPASFGRYDLIDIILINLSPSLAERTKELELQRFLGVLFSHTIPPAEKEHILAEEYGMKSDHELERRINIMCNLSQLVMEEGLNEGRTRGLAEGHTKGLAEGRLETLLSALQKLMKNYAISADEAMQILELPEEERATLRKLLGNA